MKVKKGDNIIVIAGKDKGKKGKVLNVLPKKERILVEAVNIRKKHLKPKKSGEKGQIVERPGYIHVSNAQVICPKCAKASRLGYRIEGEKKYRYCKKCNQEIQ